MKTLSELFKDIPHRSFNISEDFTFSGLSCDSHTVNPGDIFVAVKGPVRDGNDFTAEAVKKGAVAVCSDRIPKRPPDRPFVAVKDAAKTLPILASRFFDDPSKSLKVIGITGTNGKTTTACLVYAILKAAKKAPSLMGTIECRIGGEIKASINTTPGPLLLHSLLRQMKDRGTDYVVMEVSSHALKQSRVSGVRFCLAALTNVTRDHLDYHRSIAEYARAKKILFESLDKKSAAILNSDDRFYESFRRAAGGRVISYGIKNKADFEATRIATDIEGSVFSMNTPRGIIKVRTALIGEYNVYNILAAAAIAFAEGIEMDLISEAIERFDCVPGRLEPVRAGQPFKVFIDYAHTHDALKNVLMALRKISAGKIVLLFGCGGNRDRGKRRKMGMVASQLADFVILADDNPRDEDPEAILGEIERGFKPGFRAYKKIPDRFKAIEESLTGRDPSDTVVIAGKGHEQYQVIGGKTFEFNDKKTAERVLSASAEYVQGR